MKMSKIVIAAVLTVAMGYFSSLPVYAQSQQVCFCHNINNNPTTICTDNQGLINGHQGHVESGSDTLGACVEVTPTAGLTMTPSPTAGPSVSPTPTPTGEQPPTVPEFGLLTGLFSLAASTGGYFMLKRRNV